MNNIYLTKKDRLVNFFLSILIGGFIFGLVMFRILFPVFEINGISASEIKIVDIENKKFLKVRMKYGYPFHKVSINIVLPKEDRMKKERLGTIYQDELAVYKEGQVIDNLTELKKKILIVPEINIEKGSLVSEGDSVYFVSNGEYRAFESAETFDRLGFDWKKIIKGKLEYLNDFKKGPNITLNTFYLPYSFIEVGNKKYLLGDNIKYLLNPSDQEVNKYVDDRFSVIKVDKQKLEKVGNFTCKDMEKGKVFCEYKDVKNEILDGANLIVEIKDDKILNNKLKIIISAFDRNNFIVPKMVLRKIKQNLLFRYRKCFGYKLIQENEL